jgi:hypothetical protein
LLSGASTYAAQWVAIAEDAVSASERASAAYRHLAEGLLCEPTQRQNG